MPQFNECGKQGTSVEALIQKQIDKAKARGRDIDFDTAYEEVVAESMEKMLTDSAVAQKLQKLKQTDKTLWQKLKDLFKKLLDVFKDAQDVYSIYNANSEEAALVSKFSADAQQKLAEMYAEAFNETANAYQASEKTAGKNIKSNGVSFQLRDVGGRIMPVLDTQNDTRDYKVAEAYLKTLVDAEHPFATILNDAQPVYVGKDLPGEYKGSEYTHNLNSAIRNVKMQAATNLDEMLLLAENGEWRENVKEKHLIDAKNGWYRYDTQFAVPILNAKKAIDHYTVYGGTLLIRNDADGKSYLYDLVDIEKKKVVSSPPSTDKRSGVFEPKPSQAQYMQDKVKSQEKLSHQDRDSDGNELSEGQQEFFKDSKVRDADGNLIKVYHGTSEKFTVFDKTKGRANMDIQGSFFSPWELDAQGYGENVGAYYLNIVNPASESMGYKALNKFKGQNGAGIKAREYLERLGYDGVNNGNEEYIAFNSNQIKSVTNLNPTENPDIRYQDRTSYADQVGEVKNNTHDKNNHVYMGTTPVGIANVLGLPKLPMLVTPQHIYSMAVSEQQARAENRYRSRSNYHNLSWDKVKNLPNYIDKPVLIIKSNSDVNDARFVVVTGEADSNGNPIIVAIEPNGKGYYFNIEFPTNFVLSGYGKNSIQNFVATAKTENRILYANKKIVRLQRTSPASNSLTTFLPLTTLQIYHGLRILSRANLKALFLRTADCQNSVSKTVIQTLSITAQSSPTLWRLRLRTTLRGSISRTTRQTSTSSMRPSGSSPTSAERSKTCHSPRAREILSVSRLCVTRLSRLRTGSTPTTPSF